MGRGRWLAVAGLLVLTACDAPTRPAHTTRISKLDPTAASLDVTGDVGLSMTVFFPNDDGGRIELRAPTLGTITDVRLDDSPRPATGESVDLDLEGKAVNVAWELHGAVERYAGGAIVTIPLWTPPPGARGDDRRVPIAGVLQLPAGPTGRVRWHGASPADVRVENGGTFIRFRGEIGTSTSSELTFVLPADSVPRAPVLAGADRVASYESRQAPLDAGDAHIAGDLRDDRRREDVIAALYWGVVGIEIAIPFLLTLLALARTVAVRRRAVEGGPTELSDPPSDLAPAVVALLRAEGQDIGDDAIAATILGLGNDHTIEIEGITSEQYTMRVRGSSARAGETELLAALRELAGPSGVIKGPPLGLSKDGVWWGTLRQDVVAVARSNGLLRRRFRSGLFVTAVVALAITTIPLYARSPETLIAGVVVGTILATLPFIGGYVLTAEGHRQRARWEAYGRHLRAADLGDVGVPGVIVWEKALVYGAALGIAEQAIGDLT